MLTNSERYKNNDWEDITKLKKSKKNKVSTPALKTAINLNGKCLLD